VFFTTDFFFSGNVALIANHVFDPG